MKPSRTALFTTQLLIVIGAVMMVIPLYWMIVTSIKAPEEIFVFPPKWWPSISYGSGTTSRIKIRVKEPSLWGNRVENGKTWVEIDYPLRGGAKCTLRHVSASHTLAVQGDESYNNLILTSHNGSSYAVPLNFSGTKNLNVPFANEKPLTLEIKPIGLLNYVYHRLIKNYVLTWKAVPFARFYLNSLFVAVCITLGQLLTCSLGAYAFARLRFPLRNHLFIAYIATMMIPGIVTMIPVFIIIKYLNWLDTYYALICPFLFSAYGTFLLRQFFLTLPGELEESAKLDGAGYLRIFTYIAIPLSKPALATLAIFTFIASWLSFMWPVIVINSLNMQPLPVGLKSFQGMFQTDWGLLMAGSLLSIVPMILIFLFNQRYFVEGIKLTGLKV